MAELRGSHPRAMQEPSPLHSASIHISSLVDVDSSSINPQPWEPQARGPRSIKEALNQDYLSPMKLIQLTQEPDLRRVTYLELSIHTTDSSVGNFGTHLPNLTQLRFVESSVPCIRDLGTGLSSLKILWMSRCKLKDLDGLPSLQSLQEFYLPFNHVEDISVITMLSSLDVLDLESNNLTEEDQLGYLALCPALSTLTLEGNPLSIKLAESAGGESGYRATIHDMVPNIQVLDDMPLVKAEDKKKECEADRSRGEEGEVVNGEGLKSHSSLFALSEAGLSKDWHILQRSIKQGRQLLDTTGGGISPRTRPTTAPAHRSLSVSPSPPPAVDDESSELTHGLSQVICGNPVRALRARKQQGLGSQSVVLSGTSYIPTPSFNTSLTTDQHLTLSSLLEDLSLDQLPPEDKTQQPDHFRITTTHLPIHLTSDSLTATPPESTPLTPTPPPLTPSRRLPTPPAATDPIPPRPKSVTDFRHRRYRKSSTEIPRSFVEAAPKT